MDEGDSEETRSPIYALAYRLAEVAEGGAMTVAQDFIRKDVAEMTTEEAVVFRARVMRLKDAAERAFSITVEAVSAKLTSVS
jgi:hypothetical protein